MHTDIVSAQSPFFPGPHARQEHGGVDYRFGSFFLSPARKLLACGERQVVLGGRAFDLLLALVVRAGEVVSHHELVAAVWPHAVVEENGLRVHMSALRKALGDTPADQYVLTVPGCGYRFVKPVRACPSAPETTARGGWPALAARGPRLARLVGREAALAQLAQGLARALATNQTPDPDRGRLATIVGAAGCGKSALAQAYASTYAQRYPGGCHIVDCASDDNLAQLGSLACERQALLVLDNCEPALAAAALAARIGAAGDDCTVLATSRAPLGVAGEWLLRLPPLALPAAHAALDCEGALALAAIALFVERAEANCSRFVLTPATLPAVIALCRQLDGLPLALELAAARVEALGVEALAARPDDLLRLLTRSRRLAGPRHASLEAMFDASHRLLDEAQRMLLRRLALFDGDFAPATTLRVCAFGALTPAAAEVALAALEAISLLAIDGGGDGGAPARRLLNTTRRYAYARLVASGEVDVVAQRMARERLGQT